MKKTDSNRADRIEFRGTVVKKSNALIRSHWHIDSVWEPRLIAILASKIRIEDEDFKSYKIPVLELMHSTSQKRSGRLYEEISSAIKNMMGRVITIYDEEDKEKLYTVFSKCVIDKREGMIEVWFHSDLKKHYIQLKNRFTSYNLEEFMKLPSTYSQRLYEILMSWRNMPDGETTIPIDELHRQLDTSPSQRKDFKEFRLRVLEKAYSDINNKSNVLHFEWEAIKNGRKVIAIRFIFDPKKIRQAAAKKLKEGQKKRSVENNRLFKLALACQLDDKTSPPSEKLCEFCKTLMHYKDCQKIKVC